MTRRLLGHACLGVAATFLLGAARQKGTQMTTTPEPKPTEPVPEPKPKKDDTARPYHDPH